MESVFFRKIIKKGNKLTYSLILSSGGNHLTVLNEVIQKSIISLILSFFRT